MANATVTLSAGAVARQLGISPATLRTWAHRYGLEPSARSEGSHRRYTPEDVDKLVAMQRLVRSGMPLADAAAQVKDALPVDIPDPVEPPREIMPGHVRSLWDAAQALDGQRCAGLIAQAVKDNGVLSTWQHLVRPTLIKAGDQWEREQVGIEVEHVLSDAVTAGFVTDRPVRREGVLLSATTHEDHVLPLYALRAALAERGIGAELLTARTPAATLGEAARRVRPGVIILWAQLPDNADVHGFDQLPGLRPKPALAAAGPGWPDPTPWPHLGDLQEAVNFVRTHV